MVEPHLALSKLGQSLFRSTNPRALLVAAVPAIVDLNIAADRPAQPVETFLKNCQNGALDPEHCV